MVVVFRHKFLFHDKYAECQTTTLQDASLLLCSNSHQQLLKCNSAWLLHGDCSNQSQLCRLTAVKYLKGKPFTVVWTKKLGSQSGNQNPRTHLVKVSSIVQQRQGSEWSVQGQILCWCWRLGLTKQAKVINDWWIMVPFQSELMNKSSLGAWWEISVRNKRENVHTFLDNFLII